jgi:N-glycosylase/DNA lyase
MSRAVVYSAVRGQDACVVTEAPSDCWVTLGPANAGTPGSGRDVWGRAGRSSASPERTVRWGEPWHLGSAAYWVHRCQEVVAPAYSHALGDTLAEEVAACILGGYGIPSEVGMAAFRAVRDRGMLDAHRADSGVTGDELENLLLQPLDVNGRAVRYRFARQRSHRLADALAGLRQPGRPSSPRELRTWLLDLPGIGPKTASWIVRNHLGSDEVAIIDVHLFRAGVIAGVFDPDWTPTRHYFQLEEMFLAWARIGGVSAADLDAVIWSDMSRWGRSAHAVLGAPEQGWSWYTPGSGAGSF